MEDFLFQRGHFQVPENSSHLKMYDWKTSFLLGFGLFSGANC